MRWCLVLVVILGVLVAGVAKVATRHRGALASSAPNEKPSANDEDAEDASGETAPPPPPAPRPRPRPRLPTVETSAGGRAGIATLHGQVRLPAGRTKGGRGQGEDGNEDDDAIDLANLAVVAGDGVRTLSAHVDREGRFAFHLPPGQYTLTVSAGPWIAQRTGVLARSGFDREVDLELGLGATIGGRVRGVTGGLVSISVRPAGAPPRSPAVAEVDVDDQELFTVPGLVPGDRYDLTVAGDAIRTVRLGGVRAPAAELEVRVEPPATLRGAIGVAAGEACPIEEVTLRDAAGEAATVGTSEGDVTDESNEGDRPDGACAFELSVPDGIRHAVVIATGSGWRLEQPVEIPASGDPAPVCLNPPCGNPGDLAADVVVEVSGSGAMGGLMVCLIATAPRAGEDCMSRRTGPYVFERRPIGATIIVRALDRACGFYQQTLTVRRGDNRVQVACARPAGEGPDP